MRSLIVAALLLTSTSVWAQQVPPCTRGPTSIKMSGVDLDELKCQTALDAFSMGQLSQQINAIQAHVKFLEQDLAQANARAADLQKQLDAKGKPDAEQKSETSPNDGSSSTQPAVRKEDGNSGKGSEGVQPSGQGK